MRARVAFLLLALAWRATAVFAADTPTPVQMKAVIAPHISNAALLIGIEEGYFAAQGLHMEIVPIDRSTLATTALIQGEVDLISGAVSCTMLNAVARGANLRIVAEKGYYPPDGCDVGGLMVRKDLIKGEKIADLAFLKGRTVSAALAALSDYYLDAVTRDAGLNPGDVKTVDIKDTAAALEALISGSLDGWVNYEPWVTRALASGKVVMLPGLGKFLPNMNPGFVVFGPNLLEKNREAGKKFMVAYLQSVRQYNLGKTDRNVEILARRTGLDLDLTRKACWLTSRDDGRINSQGVLDFEAWGVKKGLLDAVVPAERFWDASFVDYANQVLAGAPPSRP